MRIVGLRFFRPWLMPMAGVALLALTGCGGPTSRTSFAMSALAASSTAGDLQGVWRGSFNEVEAVLYEDDADCMLQILGDGTFFARVTPGPGTNNLAKPRTWSGVVEERGNRVILKSFRGPWLTLMRSGDRLYGVTDDPIAEVPIALRLEREGARG